MRQLKESHRRYLLQVIDEFNEAADRGVLTPRAVELCLNAKTLLNSLAVKATNIPPEQLSIAFEFKEERRRLPATIKRKGRNRWAKYPFEMIETARRMRSRKCTYKDIAEALNHRHQTNVHWVTIRDWVKSFYRVTG